MVANVTSLLNYCATQATHGMARTLAFGTGAMGLAYSAEAGLRGCELVYKVVGNQYGNLISRVTSKQWATAPVQNFGRVSGLQRAFVDARPFRNEPLSKILGQALRFTLLGAALNELVRIGVGPIPGGWQSKVYNGIMAAGPFQLYNTTTEEHITFHTPGERLAAEWLPEKYDPYKAADKFRAADSFKAWWYGNNQ